MNPLNPNDWFLKADRDLGFARLGHQHESAYPDLICYHCQQAAEKFLKAVAIYHEIPFRKTHDLEALLDLLCPAIPSIGANFYEIARKINDYGTIIRYPEPGEDPSESDVIEALECAVFFRNFAAQVLNG